MLTGASGAGKTTLAHHVQSHRSDALEVFFFDSIGVPSSELMVEQYGSGEEWQRATTHKWIARINPLLSSGRPVLFEGQMRIAFIQEALAACNISTATILLVDCDDAVRTARLHGERAQPDLANPTMMNWAAYLRNEARQANLEVLNTGLKSLANCVAKIEQLVLSRA